MFGGVRVRRDDQEVDLGPPQQRALLALLLAAGGQPVGLTEIVDALWGDAPSSSAVNLVHRYVGALRRLFEPDLPVRASGAWLARVGSGYRIAVDSSCADLPAFRELAAAARAASALSAAPRDGAVALFLRALELAADPPAAGIDALREHPTVLAVDRERTAVALEAADAALAADASLAAGSAASVVPFVQRVAVGNPLDEPLHARLVLLLAEAGRHAEALTTYQAIRRRLADDLGIDPSPVLHDAHQRVLRAGPQKQPDPPRVRPAQLPASLSMFAGREAEVDAVLELIEDDRELARSPVIATISGLAGVGKTTLALHVAHRLAAAFPDGQLYVNLRGFDAAGRIVAPVDALRGFLEALGITGKTMPDELDDRAARYRSTMAGRRMLVVLDNAHDTDQVRPLLPGTPGSAVIVTSRNRLTSLIAHEGGRPVHVGPLSTDDARALLVRRLGAARVAEDPKATERIIAACAGLSLALAIVGARAAASSFNLSALADELGPATGTLDALAGDDAAVDVRAVFSWSQRALSPAAARLFRQLAAHPGPEISTAAIGSLAGLSAREVRAPLGELIDGNLVSLPAPGRFALHDLVRVYAEELLVDAGERSTALARVIGHYSASTRAAYLVFGRPPVGVLSPIPDGVQPETFVDIAAAVQWYVRERVALAALIETAGSLGDHRGAATIVLDARPMNQSVDTAHETLPLALAGLRAARTLGDPVLEAEASRDVGAKYGRMGQYDEAVRHYQRALELFVRIGDAVGETNTLRNMSITSAMRHDRADALDCARRAVAAGRRSGSRTTLAVALMTLSTNQHDHGLDEQVLETAEEGLAIVRAEGLTYLEVPLLGACGRAHTRLGAPDRALPLFEQALGMSKDHEDLFEEITLLGNYGEALFAVGRRTDARTVWLRYLRLIDRTLPDDVAVAWSYQETDDEQLRLVRRTLASIENEGQG